MLPRSPHRHPPDRSPLRSRLQHRWECARIDRLANPLTQLITTAELVLGGSMLVIGGALLAFAPMAWPWCLTGIGLAILLVAEGGLVQATGAARPPPPSGGQQP